jgi:hypothetical protein
MPTSGVCGFSLSDNDGPGLVCRQWHGHLVHDGNYEPLTPAVEGADLLVRPDLFAQLCDFVNPTRIHTGTTSATVSEMNPLRTPTSRKMSV